jgi:glycosyltransferase involved in cell wall biosynthesis
MRIATINASVTGGGAEFVARSLHEEYLARGLDAWLLAGNVNAPAHNVIEIPNEAYRGPWARTVRRAAKNVAAHSTHDRDGWWYANRTLRTIAEPVRFSAVAQGHEDFEQPGTAHLLEMTPQPPDVLHFHNLHGSYFDIRMLPELTRATPSVITLHDTWLLTGHCAHPIECERWLSGCGACPHLDRYVPLMRDASAANFALKRRVLGDSSLAFAAPSRWVLDIAEQSGVLASALDARVIPNGIDTGVFSPGDRTSARASVGLPPDSTVIVTAARAIASNPFKGFDVLISACESLAGQGTVATLLAIGSEGAAQRIGDIEIRFVPPVNDPGVMAAYYRAADIYVHPARAEVLGLTILEAMACGTPVVASRVGGIPEVVVDGESGLLVRPGDEVDLARSLFALLGDPGERERIGANGVRSATARHTIAAQADAYLAYYEETVLARDTQGAGR